MHFVSATTWRRINRNRVEANVIDLQTQYVWMRSLRMQRGSFPCASRNKNPKRTPRRPQQRPAHEVREQRAVRPACTRVRFVCLDRRDAETCRWRKLRKTTNCLGTRLRRVGSSDSPFPATSARRFHCLSSEARWLSAALNQATASAQMKTPVRYIGARSHDSGLSVQVRSRRRRPAGCPHLQRLQVDSRKQLCVR